MICKVNVGYGLLGLSHLAAARTNQVDLRQAVPIAALMVTSPYLRASNQLRVGCTNPAPTNLCPSERVEPAGESYFVVHARGAQLHERRASGMTRVAGVLQLLGRASVAVHPPPGRQLRRGNVLQLLARASLHRIW